MIGEDEATIERSAAPRTADAHPAGDETSGNGAESSEPGRSSRRWRRQNETAGEAVASWQRARVRRRREGNAGVAVVAVQSFDGAVRIDRTDVIHAKPSEDPLRLAERVREQH